MGINGSSGTIEKKINGDYIAAHLRLTGAKPIDENAGAYRKLTGSSNESLQLQINRLNSQVQELMARIGYLAGLIPPKARLPQGAIDRIIDFVCEHEHITRAELLSSRRSKLVTRPKHIAFYLATRCTSRSLSQIGHHFGRDHTTILYAAERIRTLRNANADFDAHMAWYEEQIKKLPTHTVNNGDKCNAYSNAAK